MKVTKQQAALNREKVVKTASKLFRRHGFDGISLADLMAKAGLTHGGFYRQFSSKEALLAEAAELAFSDIAQHLGEMSQTPQGRTAWARGYLSPQHQFACPVVNLAVDISRQAPAVKARFAAGLRKLLGLRDARVGSRSWNQQAVAMATLFGTMLMAKAVREADAPLAEAITQAGLQQFEKIH